MWVLRGTGAPHGQTTARLRLRRRPARAFSVSPIAGGEPKPLTTIDPNANEAAHRWPHFMPGGRAILFTVKSTNLQSFDDAQIVVRSLDTGEQHPVAQGDSAQYLPTGHLVYARAGALYAVRFDAARLAVTGVPVKVADAVITHPESGGAQVAISRTGTLVYAAGGSRTAERPLLWVTAAEPRGRSPIGRRRSGGRASLLTAGASPSSSTRRSRRSGCWTSSAGPSPEQASSPAIRIAPRGCLTAFMSRSVRTQRAVAQCAFSRTTSMAPAAPRSSSTAPSPPLR